MSSEELYNVIGGAVSYTSATFLNAIARGINSLYNIGRASGTALRMLITGKRCK